LKHKDWKEGLGTSATTTTNGTTTYGCDGCFVMDVL